MSIIRNKLTGYPIYDENNRIGTFYEDARTPIFQIYAEFDDINTAPIVFRFRANGNIVEHEPLMQWIKNRVTPYNQDGIEEKLAEMGMSEYNAYMIFRDGNGLKLNDWIWVKFRDDMTFDNTHPRGMDKARGLE